MWKKSDNCIKKRVYGLMTILFISFWPFCSYAESCVHGYYIQNAEQTTNITMSMNQYNRLKAIISRQDERLNQLQLKLNMLKNNSFTESKELTESQEQLTKLREELTLTQKSLTTATTSLKQAEEILKKQEQSLQILTKEIKALEHKQTVIRRQRDVYALLFALSVGAAISGR